MTNRTQMTLKELISADAGMKPDKDGFLLRLNGIHLCPSAVPPGTFPDAGRGNGIYLCHLRHLRLNP